MSTLLTLPNEILFLIVEHLGITFSEVDLKNHPNAYLLYATCKHFSWLANYRFGFLEDYEYDTVYESIDINGKKDGPFYFLNVYPAGCAFYSQNEVQGDFAYIIMPYSNQGFYVINKKFYFMRDNWEKFNFLMTSVHQQRKLVDPQSFKLLEELDFNKVLVSPKKDFVPISLEVPEFELATGYNFMKDFHW